MIKNCRKSSKQPRPSSSCKGYPSSERTQQRRSPDTSRCLDASSAEVYCFVPISHLSGQNGTYDPQAVTWRARAGEHCKRLVTSTSAECEQYVQRLIEEPFRPAEALNEFRWSRGTFPTSRRTETPERRRFATLPERLPALVGPLKPGSGPPSRATLVSSSAPQSGSGSVSN